MTKRALWDKAGRFITGVVVLCFFLPFFGVSCESIEVITISGADMIGGCKPGGALTETVERGQAQGEVPDVNVEPLAIAAMAIAVICFGLAWIRTKRALLASCLLALAGLGVLAGLYVKMSGELDAGVKQQLEKETARLPSKGDVAIEAGGRMGFWLTCLGLISVATLSGLALRDPDDAPPGAPPAAPRAAGPPPPAPPA